MKRKVFTSRENNELHYSEATKRRSKTNTILLLLAAALMTAVSCGKESEKPEQPAPSGTADGWPEKKISRIVYSVGTFDYLTYDFSWEGNLLKEISCTMYDGSSLGRTVLEYDGGRIARVYPYDGAGTAYTDGAMHYHYDSDGRLERQTFLLPLLFTDNLCQQTYDSVVSCELVYSYADSGYVSTVQAYKTADDGSMETSTYLFEWNGGNVISISCDGQPILSNIQYDSNPNPMRFPMGMETMGVTNMIFEGVLGNSVIFLAYAMCWNENNMTTLLSGGGQCSYTYDEDGFPTSKTIGTGSQSSTYTFSY